MEKPVSCITIEPFLKVHIDAVFDLWKITDYLALQESDTPEGTAAFLDRNPDGCFVAIRDEIVVGAILCGNDGRRGHIYHVAVNESFRRQGIANRLVTSALDALTNLGISRCYTAMYVSNPFQKLFWTKTGSEKRDDQLAFLYKKLL